MNTASSMTASMDEPTVMRFTSFLDAGCNFTGSFHLSIVIIEAHRWLFVSGGLICRFFQGAYAGLSGAYGGQKPQNSCHNDDPHSKAKTSLQPYGHKQKKTNWEQNGKSELSYP